MHAVEVGKHLILDPDVCHGQLTFKGTRIPVETVLNRIATGESVDSLVKAWPQLKREAITEAVFHAREALLEKHPQRRKRKPRMRVSA